MNKVYWAVVENYSKAKTQGKIRARVKDSDGKVVNSWAETEYKVLAQNGSLTWLELKPLTGVLCNKFFYECNTANSQIQEVFKAL